MIDAEFRVRRRSDAECERSLRRVERWVIYAVFAAALVIGTLFLNWSQGY